MTAAIRPALMTRKEAAEYMGLKPNTLAIWSCHKQHGLPFYKLGSRVMYKQEDIDAWLEKQRRVPEPSNN